jgi:chemotaxis family two-component system response regulator Rcp1
VGPDSPLVILLVEDNAGDIRLVQEALRGSSLGTSLDVVGDGLEALRYLRQSGPFSDAPRPDLILLDLGLPRMDGRRVLAEVRSDPALNGIPVVIYTASILDADVLIAFNFHADGFLRKPLVVKELLSLLHRLEIRVWTREATATDGHPDEPGAAGAP